MTGVIHWQICRNQITVYEEYNSNRCADTGTTFLELLLLIVFRRFELPCPFRLAYERLHELDDTRVKQTLRHEVEADELQKVSNIGRRVNLSTPDPCKGTLRHGRRRRGPESWA